MMNGAKKSVREPISALVASRRKDTIMLLTGLSRMLVISTSGDRASAPPARQSKSRNSQNAIPRAHDSDAASTGRCPTCSSKPALRTVSILPFRSISCGLTVSGATSSGIITL